MFAHCTIRPSSLVVQSSIVLTVDCSVFGAAGFDVATHGFSTPGEAACSLLNSTLFAAHAQFRGGDGGGDVYGTGSAGGDGISMSSAHIQLFDTTVLGGSGGCSALGCNNDGAPISGTGSAVNYPGTARVFALESSVGVAPGATKIDVDGTAGDRLYLASSTRTGWLSSPALSGWWTVPYPAPLTNTPLGTLVGTSATLTIKSPLVPQNRPAELVERQGLVIAADGTEYLSTPMVQLVLRDSGTPDCDGDGDFNEFVPLDLNSKALRKDLPYAPDTGNGTAPLVDLGCYERQS